MKFSRTKVDVASMKINSVGSSCSVSFSQSDKRSFVASSKKTEGFGEENGDGNLFWHPVSFVDDEDFMDSDAVDLKD